MKRGPEQLNNERNVAARTQSPMVQNQDSNLLDLPNEILIEIAKYLNPEDLENFRTISFLFNNLVENNNDMLWQPLLNRLHAIDRTIKVIPKHHKTVRESFIEGFKTVKKRQAFEIKVLLEEYPESIDNFGITFNNEYPITLRILETQSSKLDEINCRLIQPIINHKKNTNQHILELTNQNITRLPKQLLEGENSNFWSNLDDLRIDENYIKSLPNNIEICKKLTILDCSSNNLVELPDSITNIESLTDLYLAENSITQLPERISNLFNLRALILHDNPFESLPESILKLLNNLENFHLYVPQITAHALSNNNKGIISLIYGQHTTVNVLEKHVDLHNNQAIWQPLLSALNQIAPPLSSDSDHYISLREEFVERFNYVCAKLAKEICIILEADIDNAILFIFPMDDVKSDGSQLSHTFKELTLESLISHSKRLNSYKEWQLQNPTPTINHFSNSTFEKDKMGLTYQNPGLFFSTDASPINEASDEISDIIDVDELKSFSAKPKK